jgi:hypothetical protein
MKQKYFFLTISAILFACAILYVSINKKQKGIIIVKETIDPITHESIVKFRDKPSAESNVKRFNNAYNVDIKAALDLLNSTSGAVGIKICNGLTQRNVTVDSNIFKSVEMLPVNSSMKFITTGNSLTQAGINLCPYQCANSTNIIHFASTITTANNSITKLKNYEIQTSESGNNNLVYDNYRQIYLSRSTLARINNNYQFARLYWALDQNNKRIVCLFYVSSDGNIVQSPSLIISAANLCPYQCSSPN